MRRLVSQSIGFLLPWGLNIKFMFTLQVVKISSDLYVFLLPQMKYEIFECMLSNSLLYKSGFFTFWNFSSESHLTCVPSFSLESHLGVSLLEASPTLSLLFDELRESSHITLLMLENSQCWLVDGLSGVGCCW